MNARVVAKTAGVVAVLLALDYLLLLGIGLLLTKMFEHDSWLTAENHVNTDLAHHRSATGNDISYVGSGLGNTAAIIGALAVVAIVLVIVMRKWRPSIFLVVAVAGQALVFFLVQLAVKRPRPHVHRLDSGIPTSSYPSGHTGAATALFVGSALLIAWYVRRRWIRTVSIVVLVAVPLLVAVSRLYRGAHHPTDVLAAYLNGSITLLIAAGVILSRGPLARFAPEDGDARDPQEAPVTTGAAGSR
ncbi:MAG TPA: phosphatase PAP2 family protein [Actinomycetes bacterium]